MLILKTSSQQATTITKINLKKMELSFSVEQFVVKSAL